jgi:hypothetical protein
MVYPIWSVPVQIWSHAAAAKDLPVLATRFFCFRRDLMLEKLTLRQQLGVLK